MPPPDVTASASDREDEEIFRVLDAYVGDLETGRAADPEELLAQHPAIAPRLRACLAGLRLLDSAAPVRPALPAALGDYTLIREIGRGGMGVVYEAVHRQDGRRVALKTLPFAASLDERQLQRFQNEAYAASRLEHPHIVPVLEVGCDRGTHFFTMELIQGASLAAVWHRQRRRMQRKEGTTSETVSVPAVSSPDLLPLDELPRESLVYLQAVCRLIGQAARALDHAHQLGIVHRDIKPGNLLVNGHGHLWVTDFGLASIQGADGLTMTGDILGTLRFMSPEQAAARRGIVDHRTDIYSLGVTLYELLTLEPALTGRDRQEILSHLANEEPPACRRKNAAVPRDLETIVGVAMAKEPAERYPSAGALADDLDRFLAGEPIQARPAGVVRRAVRWARRHQAWVAAAGVFTLLALVGLTISTAVVWRALLVAQQQRSLAEIRDRESRQHLYAAQMHLAFENWRRGNVARVLELLDQQRPGAGQEDHRSFEWHHLWRLCQHALQAELPGECGPLQALAVSADGSMAAWGQQGRIRVWDARARKLRCELPAAGGPVRGLALTADGQRLAAGCNDAVRIWNLPATGPVDEPPLTLAGPGGARAVAFSPDGRWLASATDSVRVWDTASGRWLGTLKGLSNAINCVAIAADNRTLAAAGNNRTIVLWTLDKLDEPGTELGSHTSYIHCLAFSSSGERLVSGSEDGVVRIWDVKGRRMQTSIRRHTGAISGANFSPSGEHVVTSSWDGSVKVWRVDDQEIVLQQGHRGAAFAAAFVTGSQAIATGGEDGCVRLWNLAAKPEPLVLAGDARMTRALSFAPGGEEIVSGGADGLIKFWSLERSSPAQTIGRQSDWIMGAAFHAASGRIVAGDLAGRLLLHSRESSQPPIPLEEAGGPIWSLALSSDGRMLAAAGYTSETVIVWDMATQRKRMALRGHTERVWSVAFSPDGKTLASAANDRTLRLWECATGRPLATLPLDAEFPFALAFSADGRLVAASGDDRYIHLFDVASQRQRPPLGRHSTTIRSLAFLPDGRTLAAAGDDGEVKLWDLFTSEERATLEAPFGVASTDSTNSTAIWALTVSTDGCQIAASYADGRVVVWKRSRPAEELAEPVRRIQRSP